MIPDPILDPIYLKDNWADNGEKAISLNTWDNAISLFRMIDEIYFKQTHTDTITPTIYPCPNGSVDIYWDKSEQYSLLINVNSCNINYFGKSKGKKYTYSEIKGEEIYEDSLCFLGYWLATMEINGWY